MFVAVDGNWPRYVWPEQKPSPTPAPSYGAQSMKTMTSLRLSFLLLLLLPFLASAQEKTRFIITDPIFKSTYNGEKVKRMSFKELKTALLSTGDEQVAHDVRKLETKHHVGGAFIYTGTGLLVIGAALNLVSTANDAQPSSGWHNSTSRTSSSGSPGLGLMAGGLVVELVGCIIHSGYKRTLKHAIYRHNEVIGGTSFSPGTTSINGQTALGATLSFTF